MNHCINIKSFCFKIAKVRLQHNFNHVINKIKENNLFIMKNFKIINLIFIDVFDFQFQGFLSKRAFEYLVLNKY